MTNLSSSSAIGPTSPTPVGTLLHEPARTPPSPTLMRRRRSPRNSTAASPLDPESVSDRVRVNSVTCRRGSSAPSGRDPSTSRTSGVIRVAPGRPVDPRIACEELARPAVGERSAGEALLDHDGVVARAPRTPRAVVPENGCLERCASSRCGANRRRIGTFQNDSSGGGLPEGATDRPLQDFRGYRVVETGGSQRTGGRSRPWRSPSRPRPVLRIRCPWNPRPGGRHSAAQRHRSSRARSAHGTHAPCGGSAGSTAIDDVFIRCPGPMGPAAASPHRREKKRRPVGGAASGLAVGSRSVRAGCPPSERARPCGKARR